MPLREGVCKAENELTGDIVWQTFFFLSSFSLSLYVSGFFVLNTKLGLMHTKLGFLFNKYQLLGYLHTAAVVGSHSRGHLPGWFYYIYKTIPAVFFALSSVIDKSSHVHNLGMSLLSSYPLVNFI